MKRNITLLYTIALLQGMVFYGPVATLYRQVQGVSVFQITLMESISLGLCIILEIPWGVLAEKIGYRRTMIVCCVLYFCSKVIFWQAESFVWFLVERLLLGVVLAGLSGLDTGMLYLSCGGYDPQRVFGVYNSLQMVGLLWAAVVFSLFVEENYPLAGLLTAISYGTAALLSFGLKEVRPGEEGRVSLQVCREVVRQTLGDRRLLLFLAGAALLGEVHQTVTVFLSQPQYAACGMDAAAMGWVFLVTALLGICGVCSAAVTEKLGTRRTGDVCFLGALAACILLMGAKTAIPAVGGVWLLRSCNSLFQPLQAELQNRIVETPHRATALSVHNMLMDVLAVGTNLVFGALADQNLKLAFVFGGGLTILGWILFSGSIRDTIKR